MRDNSNKTGIIVIVSLLVLILLIGGTYAWFTITLKGKNNNIIKAGTLSLVLDETESVAISLDNSVPMTDSEGLNTAAYTFKLKNNGTINSQYTIYLDDVELEDGETRMLDKYVKYSLTKDNEEAVTALLPTIGENPNRILDSGVIKDDTTQVYTLRLWIDENADNAVMNTAFRVKLRVEAVQTNAIGMSLCNSNSSCVDNDSNQVISVGDLITIGDQNFYIISDNGETVSALAEMNVDITTNLQSASASGVAFDDDSNVYEGSLIEGYVNSYVAKLNTDNGATTTGRLMTYAELNLGKEEEYESWIYATNYLIDGQINGGTTNGYPTVIYVLGGPKLSMGTACNDASYGLRPVITILKSEL